jgi:hypothetical protein
METIIETISVMSEYSTDAAPTELEIRLNGSEPDCPVIFYSDGIPVFAMQNDEIEEFIDALKKLQIN